MTTSGRAEIDPAFAVWLTGPPGAGKSAIARRMAAALAHRGVDAAVLESDELRRVLTPEPTYSDRERDIFYRSMVHIGRLLTAHGVPVIFDATAHRRAWRDQARQALPKFLEVHIDCPLTVRRQRDPKGLYRRADQGDAPRLPGAGVKYEPPEKAELTVHTDRESPEDAADRIVAELVRRRLITAP